MKSLVKTKQRDRPLPQLSRRERNKADKRARVLAAARELFTKYGYENTSMKAISERADVGFGTLFLIADSKRDLLFKLFQDPILKIRDEIRTNVDYSRQIPDVFLIMLYPYFDLFAENVQISQDYLREMTFAAAKTDSEDSVHFGEFFIPLAQTAIDELKKQGRAREDLPANIAAQALYATFMGAVRTWLRAENPNADEGKAQLRSLYEVVCFGLR